jgi:2-methylcitrate dehydratase
MSFIASRSFARASTRNLVAKASPRAPLCSSRLAQHQAKSSASSFLSTQRHTSARCFSTTMVQASAGDAFAAPAPAAQYDQEIVDMASYIHNYKIDSDLAVSCY